MRKDVHAQGAESRSPTLLARRNKNMTPTKLKRAQRKLQLNRGKGYTYKVGRNMKGKKVGDVVRTVRPKKIKLPWNDTCKKQCTVNISEEERAHIFKSFWDVGDINLQRSFLLQRVKVTKKSRERKRKHDAGREIKRRSRRSTRTYSFRVLSNDASVELCQKFFLNTLGTDKRRVRTTLEKCDESGLLQSDQRFPQPF